MKSIYKSLLTVFSVALMMFACTDEEKGGEDTPSGPELTISDANKDLSFLKDAGSRTIAVTASGVYTAAVTSGGEWCTVSDVTATSFVITVDENTGLTERPAKITLSLSGLPSIEITVTQFGSAAAMKIAGSDKTLSFSSASADTTIAITANVEYSAAVEAGKTWCVVSNQTATGFKITVAANTDLETRTAKVAVWLPGQTENPISDTIVVTQLGVKPSLSIQDEDKLLSFSYSVGDTTVAVAANGEYTVKVSDTAATWCTVSDITATGFKIRVAANTDIEPRKTDVIVSFVGSSNSETVTVVQAATPLLTIGNEYKTLPFGAEKANKTVFLTSNGDYTVKVEDGAEWCTVSDTFPNKFTVQVPANYSGDRTAKITVSLAGAEDIELVVTQPTSKLSTEIEPNQLTFNSVFAGEESVTITILNDRVPVNGAFYTVVVPDTDTAWVAVERNGSELTVKVKARTFAFGNNTAIPERIAQITVQTTGARDAVLNVTQSACLDKSLIEAHYVGDDNRTMFDPSQSMAAAFDNISINHGPTSPISIYCTAPNTDGTTAVPPAEGSTAWAFPFYFTMDLGADVYLNSFKITPRANRKNRSWEYRLGSPYKFKIYGTNVDKADVPADDPYWQDEWKNDWYHLGDFTCHNPSGLTPETITSVNDITAEDCLFAAAGYNFELPSTATPVRYLRFQIDEVWEPGITYVHFQELWFWGDPAN